MPRTGFAALRDIVLADPRAQARLRATPGWEDFVVVARLLAEERGIELARADLMQARAAGRRRADRAPAASALAGWTPVGLSWRDGAPEVQWRDLRGLAFADPFLEDTVDRALREPYRRLFGAQTGIDELAAVAACAPTVAPSGFVFHASRCGSTLVATMLAALDATIVASEPPLLDGVLRSPVDDATRAAWLRWALTALGQPRAGGERRFFVKLDSWSTRDMAFVRSCFPSVPCLFVYRDPAEIVASHLRMRGSQMVPGAPAGALFGLAAPAPRQPALPAEEHCARIVGAILEAADGQLAAGCRLVHYRDLPEDVCGPVAGHLGIEPSRDERARMARAAQLDAKNPLLAFDAAQPGRVWPVTPAIRTAARTWATAAYERLEARRAAEAVAA